jgi:AraC-like DNA-binding protein
MQPSDTLYTAEVAMDVFNQDPSRALVIIDSALLVGNVDDNLATMLKAKIYSQSNKEQHLDTAQQMLEGLMESDFVKDPDKREVVLDLLVSTTRLRDDYEQCLRWATEKANLCQKQDKKTEALRTEAEIGVILVELGEEKEGIERLNAVITSLKGQQSADETDACIIAIKRKILVMKKLGREEEMIPLAQRIIEILDDYREHYTEYADNSYRLPTDKEEVEEYCNYYTAQAYGNLAYAYAVLNDTKQARHYLSLFEKSDYGSTLYGRETIAPTWCLLGDYDKMLATYDEVTAQIGDDTVNLDYATMLRGRAIAAKARGNTAAATSYWQRYSDMKDLLHKQLQRSKAHEYAARYRLQEERLNTEREEAAKNRMGIIASLLGFLLFVVAVFASLLVRQLRSIREKNAVLTKEISEKIEYEEKYQQLVDSGQCVVDSTREQMLPTANYPLPTQELESLSDSELFDQIRRIILEEKLFLDPHFNRQQLIDRLHLSKGNIGSAFSKGSHYASLASFINEMRLIHGAKLLSEHPEMSISDIAIASGFASNITFSHNFKERYALTPTEFRIKN